MFKPLRPLKYLLHTLHKTFPAILFAFFALFAEFVLANVFRDTKLGIEMAESPAWFKEIFCWSIGLISVRQACGQDEDIEKDGKWEFLRVVLKSGEWSVSLEDCVFC